MPQQLLWFSDLARWDSNTRHHKLSFPSIQSQGGFPRRPGCCLLRALRWLGNMVEVPRVLQDVRQLNSCSDTLAFGLITRADVAPPTLDLENKSKNRDVNTAANGLPTHLNAHHMVTRKQTVSEWRLCSTDSRPGRERRSRSDPSGSLWTSYHRRCFGLMWRISRQHSWVVTHTVTEPGTIFVKLVFYFYGVIKKKTDQALAFPVGIWESCRNHGKGFNLLSSLIIWSHGK